MKKFRLTLITENQNSFNKGKKFAESISKILNTDSHYEISRYEKLAGSYKIEFIGQLKGESHSVYESIILTDRICSPWIVKFNQNTDTVELTFNKTAFSNYRNNKFNVLIWAYFKIEEV